MTLVLKKIIPSNVTDRHLICCELCYKNPKTVLIYSKLCNKIHSICCEYWTVSRASVMENHLKSNSNIECVKVKQLNSLTSVESSQQAPLDKLISRQNNEIAKKKKCWFFMYNF